MAFKQTDMQFLYKWTAAADKDNPYYRHGSDSTLLNREEGYEMLYFINHFGDKNFNTPPTLTTYKKIEKMIKTQVPTNIRSHKKIAEWIVSNW